jgi:hypothetical protein
MIQVSRLPSGHTKRYEHSGSLAFYGFACRLTNSGRLGHADAERVRRKLLLPWQHGICVEMPEIRRKESGPTQGLSCNDSDTWRRRSAGLVLVVPALSLALQRPFACRDGSGRFRSDGPGASTPKRIMISVTS